MLDDPTSINSRFRSQIATVDVVRQIQRIDFDRNLVACAMSTCDAKSNVLKVNLKKIDWQIAHP